SINGHNVIQLDLINTVLAGAGGTGGVDVKVTLLDNLFDPTGNGAQTISVGGVDVVATDHDGDQAHSQGTVHVVDDTPQAVGDGTFTVAALNAGSTPELLYTAGSGHGLLDNDHVGADGGHITAIDFGGNHYDFNGSNAITIDVDGGKLTVGS